MAQNQEGLVALLYQNTYDKLFRVAYRLTGNKETTKDLIQEVFLLALFRQEELSNHPKPEAWLMITLVNLIKNERRRLSSHNLSLDTMLNLAAQEVAPSLEEILPRQLSTDEIQILIWRFEQQLSYREMADRLGISEVGCRSRVSRAVSKCKSFLDLDGSMSDS